MNGLLARYPTTRFNKLTKAYNSYIFEMFAIHFGVQELGGGLEFVI